MPDQAYPLDTAESPMSNPTPINRGGRPPAQDKLVPLPLRVPASVLARLPKNADGKPDQEQLRQAVVDWVDALEEGAK